MDFTNVVVGRESKLIGVEIECFNANPKTIVAKLKEKGVSVQNFSGYSKQTSRTQWLVTTDASVTTTGTGIGKGLEIVSPPLTIAQMEVQLKMVCEVLNELGAKIDKTCGIHVHHEIDDLPLQGIKNIFSIYHKHIKTIEGILPSSRRGSTNPRYCKPIEQYQVDRIQQVDSANFIKDILGTRYKTINFDGYISRGTCEFRQHAGSTDFDKIFNWILITQSIVASAKKKKNIKPLSPSANETISFNKEIGIYNTVQGVYVRDRKRQLAKAN